MPTSVELRQQRAGVVESMRSITEAAETANRGLEAEERQSYDRHEQDFRSLTERIERQEAEELRSAQMAEPIQRGRNRPDDGGRGTEEQRTQERRSAFFQALRRGLPRMAPEQRALVENAAGEILVPEDLETEINRALPELTIMRGIASQRSITTNRVRRRSLAEVAVGWGKLETAEQDLTDSMPSTPTDEYTYIEDLYGLAKVGEDELDDSDVNLDAFIRDSFARACAEAEDTGFTVGAGHAAHQPVGFMTAGGGVPTVAAAGAAAITTDDMMKLIYATPKQYRRNGRFAIPSGTELAIATLKDADDRYLWQPSLQAGRPNTFLGFPVENQEDMAAVAASARVAAFGDFNAGYRIYDRQGMTVKVLDQLYAEDGLIGWKIRKRVGGDVVRPQALRILAMAAA
ncbi:phage major capsid protein [Streptomyces fulvorobeus]|uniref:HK97 family phage major capsid protein n=1 Tax=Streptomyces fulvorobeus TaxID=284028 RepID=A0A7J0C5M5_9ACTN|nr:phage major capsid protein [Streptomyces fulvorobeus]NYE40693.1 HK97 family phage major capsid protein [Streptomyces fulvorobeus]GFM96996.1 phage capsid protein [Streptomyces fulvorobeus]